MIAKAPEKGKRGKDTYGLLRYLFGPGRFNEHTDPHLVAAWDPEWLPGGVFTELAGRRGWLVTLGGDIDAAMTGHEVDVDGGHVYHVVLSVPPADSNPDTGLFGDARWRHLVESAIEHMGLGAGPDGQAGCRWVAVHHGLSAEGNDHVHLVVNLVRGDGAIADTYRDWPRWRAWCRQVEDRYGLTATAPVGEGRGKAVTRPELTRAAEAGTTTERDRLRAIVAEAAVEAESEEQFLQLLREAGVRFAPHVSGGRVTGYKVALDPGDSKVTPFWLAGSSLRRDLSLPRLRARWDGPVLPDERALRLWNGDLVVEVGSATSRHTYTWRQVTRLLEQADTDLRCDLAASSDPLRWHQAVEHTADVVAVLVRVEQPPAQLHRVYDQLTRAAQLPRGRRPPLRRPGVALPLLMRAARLAAASRDPAAVVLAGIVLLLYGIVTALADYAQQRALRAAARQQITTAGRELEAHPAISAHLAASTARAKQPADDRTTVGRDHRPRPTTKPGTSLTWAPAAGRPTTPSPTSKGKAR